MGSFLCYKKAGVWGFPLPQRRWKWEGRGDSYRTNFLQPKSSRPKFLPRNVSGKIQTITTKPTTSSPRSLRSLFLPFNNNVTLPLLARGREISRFLSHRVSDEKHQEKILLVCLTLSLFIILENNGGSGISVKFSNPAAWLLCLWKENQMIRCVKQSSLKLVSSLTFVDNIFLLPQCLYTHNAHRWFLHFTFFSTRTLWYRSW